MPTLCVLLALAFPGADERPEPGKLRVLILDGQNNHDWRATSPLMKSHLEAAGLFEVEVSSNLPAGGRPGTLKTAPFPPRLEKYAVAVLNYNGAAWPKPFNADFEARVREGKLHLVVVHAANNAFSDWKEYNEMIGMGWRGNTFGSRLAFSPDGKPSLVEKGKGPGAGHGAKHPFQIVIRDTEHPVTRGMPTEWMHTADELYHGMRGPIKDVKVLATAFADKKKGGTGEHEPMIWTVAYGKGRVFHTPMGHDVDGMKCVGFQATLQRGTEWAATGKVTIGLPKNFPTRDKTSSVGSATGKGSPGG
jgi:hypothetical protein